MKVVRFTKGFFLEDIEQKSAKLAEIKAEQEQASVVLVGNDLRIEKKFESVQAGKIFYLYIISKSRGIDVKFYPLSMRADFEKSGKVEVYRDVICNANEATNALSKYVVKEKDDLVNLAMDNLTQKQQKNELERTL